MQTLSFEATNDKHLEEYFVIKVGKYRLLKIATILGANASGKSNVLKAFYMLRELLLEPCQNKESSIDYDKFALDEECLQRPSVMKVNFIVGESKYMYEVEFDNRVVYHELLKCQPFDASREHLVYDRSTNKESLVASIKWGERYRSVKNTGILSGNLLHNRTLFGAYQNSNVDIPWIKEILDWIRSYFMPMITASREQRLMQYVSRSVLKGEIGKQDLLRQIIKADVGINNIDIEEKREPLDTDLVNAILHYDNAPAELKQKIRTDPTSTIVDVRMSHTGYQKTVPFDYSQESGGTQRYYELSGPLLELIGGSHFLAIDELECRLHPDLYEHFVLTYIKNAKRSQIAITTHMREFLRDKDTFRDDAVWITEKSDKGDTNLYSLADFDTDSLRKENSRYNFYKAGRFGGIPRLGDTYVQISNVSKDE